MAQTDSTEAWNAIIKSLPIDGIDIPTAPITRAEPKWFRACYKNDRIEIYPAVNHHPISKISTVRMIDKDEFLSVYPFYFRRKNRESVSAIVGKLTVNQVYIYGLIMSQLENHE